MVYLLCFACVLLAVALSAAICCASMLRSERDYWLRAWDDRGDVILEKSGRILDLTARAQDTETRLSLKYGELAAMSADAVACRARLDSASAVVDGLRGIIEDLRDEADEALAEVFGDDDDDDDDEGECGGGPCRCPSRN